MSLRSRRDNRKTLTPITAPNGCHPPAQMHYLVSPGDLGVSASRRLAPGFYFRVGPIYVAHYRCARLCTRRPRLTRRVAHEMHPRGLHSVKRQRKSMTYCAAERYYENSRRAFPSRIPGLSGYALRCRPSWPLTSSMSYRNHSRAVPAAQSWWCLPIPPPGVPACATRSQSSRHASTRVMLQCSARAFASPSASVAVSNGRLRRHGRERRGGSRVSRDVGNRRLIVALEFDFFPGLGVLEQRPQQRVIEAVSGFVATEFADQAMAQ
jgi:hypothetical protein